MQELCLYIIIAIKATGKYYLFSNDTSENVLYDYSNNTIETASDEASLRETLEDFCEWKNNSSLTEISSKMSRLPINVRCFVGVKLKGAILKTHICRLTTTIQLRI